MESTKEKWIDEYQILQTLGKGASCKVKLAYDTANKNKKVAVKILNSDMGEDAKQLLLDEINSLDKIDHPHVIKYLKRGKSEYKPSGEQVRYIALEIAEKGELFDFVLNTGRFSEEVARYFFKQMIDGLQSCHQAEVYHRDMKADNLFVDNDYNLKIGDFGFATCQDKADSDGMFNTNLGTPGYMAPEINLEQPYHGQPVDIFSSGVILFIMVAQSKPFADAKPNDKHYKRLFQEKFKKFWDYHEDCQEMSFSDDFKDLFQGMVKTDPDERLTMDAIVNHPWMQGDTPSDNQIYSEFSTRDQENSSIKKDEKIASREEKYAENSGPRRAGEETLIDHVPDKAMKDYIKVDGYNQVILSNSEPDAIETKIIEIFAANDIEHKVDENKYKIKFDFESTEDKWGSDNKIEVQIKITKVNQVTCAIEFTKLSGNDLLYLEDFSEKKKLTFQEFAIDEKDE